MVPPPPPNAPRAVAARVAWVYAGLAAAWILFSDRTLDLLVGDPVWHLRLSVAKGWAFVAVTALLLYAYLKVRADDRLALLEAARHARVVPWRWEARRGAWHFEASAESVLGVPPSTLEAQGGLERAFHPGDLHRFATARRRALQGQLATFDARLRSEGGERWTRWTLQGTPWGLQGVVQDVAELHRVRTELVQHQRRELVPQMAAGVTHDLKNLMQAIQGSAELLRLTPRPEGDTRSLDTILKASTRAQALLQQVLGLVRTPEAQPGEPGDLADVVAEAGGLLHHALPRSVALRLELPGHPLPCRFDEAQILQVLMNLGLNARDAALPEGWVRLAAFPDRGPGGEAEVVVEVTDSGPGVPEGDRERIFEPFVTSKAAGQGTGLGLPMARALAEAHGGRLECLGAPGEGARFRLSLPALAGAEPPTAG